MSEPTGASPYTASSYRSNPSVEYLLANLVIHQHTLELLETRYRDAKDAAEQRARLHLCRKSLDEAWAAMMKRPFRRSFLAWGLFHQVSEELIMFLDTAELAAEGKKIELDIELSALPEATKRGWLTRLGEVLIPLAGAKPTDEEINSARQIIKTVLNVLNSQTDNRFWEIWTKKLFGLIYAVMLVIGLVLFILLGSLSSGFLLCVGNVLLLGAIGGVASGILSADPQNVAKGQFWVSTLYYSLVRPILGALAALLVFWMLQSQYLIQIKPPADCRKAVLNSLTCPQDARGKAEQDEPKVAAEHSTMIVLTALPGQQIYLYFLVLLLAGFSGDKVLKVIADKTFAKLFAEAEKTKAAK